MVVLFITMEKVLPSIIKQIQIETMHIHNLEMSEMMESIVCLISKDHVFQSMEVYKIVIDYKEDWELMMVKLQVGIK